MGSWDGCDLKGHRRANILTAFWWGHCCHIWLTSTQAFLLTATSNTTLTLLENTHVKSTNIYQILFVNIELILTRTIGHIEVGGSMWSRCSPRLHSGLTCEAHLLCNCSKINENHILHWFKKKLIKTKKLYKVVLLTNIWHHRQWSPVIPLYVLMDFLHLLHLPLQFPSTQWCVKFWKKITHNAINNTIFKNDLKQELIDRIPEVFF